jgi:hypothetical protein
LQQWEDVRSLRRRCWSVNVGRGVTEDVVAIHRRIQTQCLLNRRQIHHHVTEDVIEAGGIEEGLDPLPRRRPLLHLRMKLTLGDGELVNVQKPIIARRVKNLEKEMKWQANR